MEKFDISDNAAIDDDGAKLLLSCLHCLNDLNLSRCSVSLEMLVNLFESGRRQGCKVNNSKYRNNVSRGRIKDFR